MILKQDWRFSTVTGLKHVVTECLTLGMQEIKTSRSDIKAVEISANIFGDVIGHRLRFGLQSVSCTACEVEGLEPL